MEPTLFIAIPLVTWKNNFRQTADAQPWVPGRYATEMNEVSLSLRWKRLAIFVANAKNRPFKQKLEFWKTSICHPEPDSLSPDEIHECNWFDMVLWNESTFRKSNSVNQYFLLTSVWCFKNYAWLKDIQSKDRPRDCNVMEHIKFTGGGSDCPLPPVRQRRLPSVSVESKNIHK